jgi:uncharacterized protein
VGFRPCHAEKQPQAEACATQPAPVWESAVKLKCPICKQPVDSETSAEFPFCSARCRERDLGNWAMGKYKITVPMMDESEPEEIDANERSHPESSDKDE